MRLRILSAAALTLFFAAVLSAAPPKYDYYLTGNGADVTAHTTPGYVLMGGGTDVDEAFTWMSARAGGGDFVVIRATGADGYNQYIYDLGDFDSVETLVIKNREAASDPTVVGVIRNAEALFIAGGDQSDYVNYWKGTPVEDAIREVAARCPVGGTSAGLAILGELLYSAQRTSVTSSEALADPYSRNITLDRDFLNLPFMGGIITDSHFVERDRMGRFVTFLARIVKDGWEYMAHGIAVEAQTALLVDERGQATVVANPGHATSFVYMMTGGVPEVCEPRTPLTYRGVQVTRLAPGDGFDLVDWSTRNGTSYTLSAEAGALSSSRPDGGIY